MLKICQVALKICKNTGFLPKFSHMYQYFDRPPTHTIKCEVYRPVPPSFPNFKYDRIWSRTPHLFWGGGEMSFNSVLLEGVSYVIDILFHKNNTITHSLPLLFLMPEFGIKIGIFLNKIMRGRRPRKNFCPIFFQLSRFFVFKRLL